MRFVWLFLLLALGACATRPSPIPPPAPSPPPPAGAPLPPPGLGTLVVPPRLPDGSYATPNHAVSAAGAVWHLRAGLNVAVLGCRGADEAALVAAYNAALAQHRADFAAAYRTLGREYGALDAFDGAMTRLYNYYALPPAQPELCRVARTLLTELAAVPAGTLGGFAPAALRRLDAPYVALFAAHDAWRAQQVAPVLATVAAPVSVAVAVPAAPPRLSIDPAVFEPR